MGAFLGISLWVALATVIPGLVTIATIYSALIVISPQVVAKYSENMAQTNDWILAGYAVSIMVLTQALGIILERFLIGKEKMGPREREIEIARGVDPHGVTHFTLRPYFEYQGLYILLAELRSDEDTQGHLKRALAQYFLTNNTLVSFITGIVAGLVLFAINPGIDTFLRAALVVSVFFALTYLSFSVALIRFEVMAKALWAARRRRLEDAEEEYVENLD